MKCDLSKELLISYVYNEVNDTERKRVEARRAECAECRSEVEALTATSTLLEEWQDESIPFQLRFEPTQQTNFWQAAGQFIASLSPTARKATAATGILAACLLMLSLTNFNLSYSSNGFRAGFGPLLESTPSNNTIPQDYASFRQATLDSVTKMIQDSERIATEN